MPNARCRIERVRVPIHALLSAALLGSLSACKLVEDTIDVGEDRDHSGPFDGDASASEAGADAGDGGLASGDGSGGSGGSGDGAVEGPPGATMDAAVLGLDASLMLPDGTWILADGGILLPDGRVIDAMEAEREYGVEPDVSRCEIADDNAWQGSVDIDDESSFALVPGALGFGLAYRALATGNCRHDIETAQIPATSGFPMPHGLIDECATITDVTLASIGTSWHLAWVDNFSGSAELYTAELDDGLQIPAGERRQLTDNELLQESKPVLKEISGRPLLAWISHDLGSDTYAIHAQWLDDDSGPIELLSGDAGHEPAGLALSQVGEENAVVGWVGPETNPGVWLVRLDAAATPLGEPIKLTGQVGASSSLDLTQHPIGGAAVYSIDINGVPQVRFRRLDVTGMPIAEERIVIGAPLHAQDASVFGVAGGYAVAYRALPAGSVHQPELRMTFISKEGNVMRDPAGSVLTLSIAPATLASARSHLAVAVEGQIMIAWLDDDPGSRNNALKVVRRRLDCE
jgi:hypothetical protein